jgi:hypothetical protein
MTHLTEFVAHPDAPLIGERAAADWRFAMEGGDEHAGMTRASSVRAPASRTPAANDATRVAAARGHTNDAPFIGERAATRGAAQRKVAMRSPM